MSTSTLMLSAGGRALPVRLEIVGKKILLMSRYHKPLVDELRSMRGAEWRKEVKAWAVTDCQRNRLQLALLAGETPPEIARYDAALPPAQARRDCLKGHQLAMLAHGLGRKRCVVAAEMGTGKTLFAIELMEQVGGEWIYIAPARVLPAVELELEKWGARVRPTLVSYTGLRKFLERWPAGKPAPLGVIFDESSFLKTPGSQRTKAAQHLADAVRAERDGYVILLSGTPAPRDPTDWWAQVEIACPGFLRESSRALLEKRLAIIEGLDLGDRTVGKIVGWKWDEVELLHRRLEGLIHVVWAKDCQDLPELVFERVTLTPSAETLRAARLLVQTCATAGEALNKTRQISDGFLYQEDGEPERVPGPKDEALRDLLAQAEETGRIAIAAGFHASVDRCSEIAREECWHVLQVDGRGWRCWAPTGEVKATDEQVKAWLREMDRGTRTAKPGLLAFVCHPGSGGFGLTLHAARLAVCFSNTFNATERMQFCKRIHREGMDENRGARLVDLVHLPTDELVLKNLTKKRAMQDITLGVPLAEVLDALKGSAT